MAEKTVLIAEDDVLIGKAYEDGLSALGYTVFRAINGKEALDMLVKNKPRVLLLDLRMPEKDGFQVLEEMNSQGLMATTTVIVTSNFDQESDVTRCKKLGAKEYLVKANTSITDVAAVIEKYVAV